MKDKDIIFKNYTPHPVHLVTNGVVVEYPSLGVARASNKSLKTGRYIGGVEVTDKHYEGLINCPNPEEGVMYIVSSPTLVAGLALGRTDLCCPNEQQKDEETGRITHALSIALK